MKLKTWDEWRKEKGLTLKEEEEQGEEIKIEFQEEDDLPPLLPDIPEEQPLSKWKPLTGPKEEIHQNISFGREETEVQMEAPPEAPIIPSPPVVEEKLSEPVKCEITDGMINPLPEEPKLPEALVTPAPPPFEVKTEGVQAAKLTPCQFGFACNGKISMESSKDWARLKGVGKKLAERLAEEQPFNGIDEVAKVKGVGKTVLEEVKKVFVPSTP